MNTIEAIYEKGTFKPLKDPGLHEGQQVKIIIEISETKSVDTILELASKVYQGLTDQEIDEIEKIALNRTGFFNEKDFNGRGPGFIGY